MRLLSANVVLFGIRGLFLQAGHHAKFQIVATTAACNQHSVDLVEASETASCMSIERVVRRLRVGKLLLLFFKPAVERLGRGKHSFSVLFDFAVHRVNLPG